jgi:hypothetical protein
MAIFHLSVRVGSSKEGGAQKHGRYIRRDPRMEFDENHPADSLVMNLPRWADDADHFWKMADRHERKNGSRYREFEVALPNEFPSDESIELTREWVEQEFPNQVVEIGFHWKLGNPHAHIQVCERQHDGIERDAERYFKRHNRMQPENGGCRKSERFTCNDLPKLAGEHVKDYMRRLRKQRKTVIQEIRKSWADALNARLEPKGIPAVSHLSHEARGLDAAPSSHVGRKGLGMMKRGIEPDRLVEVEEIENRKREYVAIRRTEKQAAEDAKRLADRTLQRKQQGHGNEAGQAESGVNFGAGQKAQIRNQRTGRKTVLTTANLDAGNQLRGYFDSLTCGIRPVLKLHGPKYETPAYFVDGCPQPIAYGRTDGGVAIPRPQDITDQHLADLLLAVAGEGMAVEVAGTDEFKSRCARLCEHLGIRHDEAVPSASAADAREPTGGWRSSAGSHESSAHENAAQPRPACPLLQTEQAQRARSW